VTPYYEDSASGITIYHGDCFDLLHDMNGIGAVVTDPPYSSGGAFRGDRALLTTAKYVSSDTVAYRPEFAGDTRDQRSFLAWSSLWLNAARNASIPGAVLLSFIDWRQLPILTDAVQAGGWSGRSRHRTSLLRNERASSRRTTYSAEEENRPFCIRHPGFHHVARFRHMRHRRRPSWGAGPPSGGRGL
jgi:hypothetical protein